MRRCTVLLLLSGLAAAPDEAAYEQAPIRYSATAPADAVARLRAQLEKDPALLRRDDAHGWLASVLERLQVPASSQTLVFSKTSLQAHRITPASPRALYFNDEVFVGWVNGGEVVEIAAHDPRLGAVFYTLEQEAETPRLVRQTHACLQCHDSRGLTLGVPGYIVRSVYPQGDGLPRFNRGTHRIDHRSPYEERWGGWYVTGRHGDLKHLGNVLFPAAEEETPRAAAAGWNLDVLPPRVDPAAYLAPGSDIVALLVLEHQAYALNLLTRASHESRVAVAQSREIRKLTDDPDPSLTPGTRSRLESACEPLVEALFFAGEPPLPSPVRGSGSFAEDFAKRGPFDARGRSLRQFDLRTRLFRYPLSYLVYSRTFAGLPAEAQAYVRGRMRDVLQGRETGKAFAHLTAEDRTAIAEILSATLPGW